MIRLIVPSIEEDDLKAVGEVLASGYLVQGERVAEFEKAVADYVGCTHAVAVSSCTAALHLSLLALNVGPGDIVLVTAYSWIATANVIELCSAKPVFVDICPVTFNIDPKSLEKTLEQLWADRETARRIKAIMPVHTFGQMADMEAILELASRYHLPVIEDAACALGATLNGRQAGTWGVMGCFSFHPRKAITTGEGGIITSNDSKLVRRLRALRNHGQDPEASSPDFIMPGLNYRMTEFQAALGLSQMRKLDRIIASRRRLAAFYNQLLEERPLQVPVVSPGNKSAYQSYVVLLPERFAVRRDGLVASLKNKGVESSIGTCHMPITTYYRARYGHQIGDFPVTDHVFARSLTLPLYETLSEQGQRQVVNSLCEDLTP
jgi:dTDP-4-amino-4,6-dideoxygalactose transaminase